MNYYKKEDGSTIATMGVLDLPEITKEEFEARQHEVSAKLEAYAPVMEAACPLTEAEIVKLDMRKRVNTLGIDNVVAGRMTDYFPTRSEYCSEGELIPAGTRVRDDADSAVIWRANVDLWNTEENSPANAPALWEQVAYRSGIRIAPQTFTATNAAKLGEAMWFDGELYRSLMEGNTYMPQESGCWEKIG